MSHGVSRELLVAVLEPHRRIVEVLVKQKKRLFVSRALAGEKRKILGDLQAGESEP